MEASIGLVGFGYAVPPHIRTNADPIFGEVRGNLTAEVGVFADAVERRYLKPGESIEDLMVIAARQAIADAGLEPAQIDRLYGVSFVSEYLMPNGLYAVHRDLGLREDTLVVPLNTEFTNFITGLILAQEAIAAGRARHVLVACGASMTRHMDYAHGHAVPVGDGAGAAVVGPSGRWKLLDFTTKTVSAGFDMMNMKVRSFVRQGTRVLALDDAGVPIPIYELAEQGLHLVMNQGASIPGLMVKELLGRHGIDASDIAFIGHQPARSVMNEWRDSICPGEYRDTYDAYGNCTLAAVPITLACCHDTIATKYVVLLSPGAGSHFTGVLIER